MGCCHFHLGHRGSAPNIVEDVFVAVVWTQLSDPNDRRVGVLVCLRIVLPHGGTLTVGLDRGSGATFTVCCSG